MFICENIGQGSECGKYSKTDLKQMYSKTGMKSITNTQPFSASARVIQVIKWTLGVWISYPRGLEVISNWNLITPITRALHYLGDQVGCGIKSI